MTQITLMALSLSVKSVLSVDSFLKDIIHKCTQMVAQIDTN
jgi:hypothetical protein